MAETNFPIGSPQPFPQTLKPMLATLAAEPFSDPRWLFEPQARRLPHSGFTGKGEITFCTAGDGGVEPNSHLTMRVL